MDDILISFGGAVKSLGNGRVGGYLVRFSGPDSPDLSGEYFTADTDFWTDFPGKTVTLYDHGLDPHMKRRKIGVAELKRDDVGIWVEAQLESRDGYEKAILKLAEAGKLGWSSGSAPHLVEYEETGKAKRIASWPIVEATLTPRPCEPRNGVLPIKSYGDLDFNEGGGELALSETSETVPVPTLKQHSCSVVSACEELIERYETRYEARLKDGRVLSRTNLEELQSISSSLEELHGLKDRVNALIEKANPQPKTDSLPTDVETDPPGTDPAHETQRLRTEFMRLQSRRTFAGAGVN